MRRTVVALLLPLLGCGDACDEPCPQGPLAPALQGRFVDLTRSLDASPPLQIAFADAEQRTEPEGVSGLVADLDGDGVPEVILTTQATHRAAVFVVGEGLTPHPTLQLPPGISVLAALDLDGDGVPDLLASGAGQVAWGDGGGSFPLPVSLASPETGQGWNGTPSPYLDDVDQDGWLDILVGMQCCTFDGTTCPSLRPYLRTGPRTFVDQSALVHETAAGTPTAALAALLGPGEKVVAQLGGGCGPPRKTPVFYRSAGPGPDGLPHFEPFDPSPEDAVFRENGDARALAEREPMGAAFGDLDGDGLLDLAVTLDPFHLLLQGREGWPFVDRSACSGLVTLPGGDRFLPMLAWAVAFVDLDRDGRLDLVHAHGNDYSGWFDPEQLQGPQHTTAHWNGGDFAFADVTAQLGVGRPGQYRSLLVGDLDLDGDADLIVGGKGELPRVFRNDIVATGFALRLHGTSSNHLGIGARVEVPAIGLVPPQHLVAGGIASPEIVSEPLVFVALGGAAAAPTLRIRWPSGTEQELSQLAAGAVHDVVEPEVFRLEPSSRHLPADGVATALLVVTPRSLDGAPRSAEVTLLVRGSPATVAPAERDGESVSFRITAPAAAGSTTIEIFLDGTPLGVRPRLFWDG